MARSTHFTTTTAAVTATLLPSASVFYGAVVAAAEAFFIKLWWEGTGTAPPAGTSTQPSVTTLPIAGTTIPHLTIPVPAAGLDFASAVPLNNGGRIWYWTSLHAADSDTTVLAGGDVVTLVYD